MPRAWAGSTKTMSVPSGASRKPCVTETSLSPSGTAQVAGGVRHCWPGGGERRVTDLDVAGVHVDRDQPGVGLERVLGDLLLRDLEQDQPAVLGTGGVEHGERQVADPSPQSAAASAAGSTPSSTTSQPSWST